MVADAIEADSVDQAGHRARNDQYQYKRQQARAVGRLVDAGLDAIRLSINSFRPECYDAYQTVGIHD